MYAVKVAYAKIPMQYISLQSLEWMRKSRSFIKIYVNSMKHYENRWYVFFQYGGKHFKLVQEEAIIVN